MSLMFSDAELARMKTAQEAHMMDAVTRLAWAATKDDFNADAHTWTAGAVLACGLDMTGGREERDGGRVVVYYDARLRLPLGTVLDLRDRLQVTQRFGAPVLNGTVYEIVSPLEEGPSGLQVTVRKVDPSE